MSDMQIQENSVVQFHYTLSENGNELESSRQGSPLLYLHGHNQMFAKVEAELTGKSVGDKLSITLAPVDAYGEVKSDAIESVQVKNLSGAKKWKPGMVAWLRTAQGEQQVTIVKVGMFKAEVDTNHPLAGKTVTFDIEVMQIREASADEIAHGHAHGEGGHHH
ncbi:peptidyl-prolyl cis-trans isomerase [Alishewanella tabrizica]|uniref:Peptidyl-prolyl cis-trans isomerase n=2 Tax=Alishewanella tabrizica TaxID=671278 RepID=A0ABQ2WEN9_9ALTE|nr:peptidyl-prolyl cis-trans isomerase [Alishewanella tabrizica]